LIELENGYSGTIASRRSIVGMAMLEGSII